MPIGSEAEMKCHTTKSGVAESMQNINITNKPSTVRGIDLLNSNVAAIPRTKKDRKGMTTKKSSD